MSACAGRPGCAKALADVRADARAGLAAGRFTERVHLSGCARRCGPPAARTARSSPTPKGSTPGGRPASTSGTARIYRRSFATIRAEADLAGLPPDGAGRRPHDPRLRQVDLVDDLAYSPGVVAAARGALRAGAPILCDAAMVASGVTGAPARGQRRRLHLARPTGTRARRTPRHHP